MKPWVSLSGLSDCNAFCLLDSPFLLPLSDYKSSWNCRCTEWWRGAQTFGLFWGHGTGGCWVGVKKFCPSGSYISPTRGSGLLALRGLHLSYSVRAALSGLLSTPITADLHHFQCDRQSRLMRQTLTGLGSGSGLRQIVQHLLLPFLLFAKWWFLMGWFLCDYAGRGPEGINSRIKPWFDCPTGL
jgi:hypothetical protein